MISFIQIDNSSIKALGWQTISLDMVGSGFPEYYRKMKNRNPTGEDVNVIPAFQGTQDSSTYPSYSDLQVIDSSS